MDEFLILMRLDIITKDAQPSPQQLQVYMKQYQDWVGGIAARNKFVGGKGLSTEGKVIKSGDVITDGPFAEIKESIDRQTLDHSYMLHSVLLSAILRSCSETGLVR